MNDELQNYMGRPKRYDNIDGTGEMFMGLMILGFALAGYLEAILPENSSRWMHGIVLYGVLIPVLGFGYWVRRVIKKHITWPRTGYAAYPRRGGKSWWIGIVATFLIAAVIAAAGACLMGFARRHDAMSIPRMGMLASIIAVYAFWVFFMCKKDPWKWLVLIFMGLGLLAITLIVPGDFIWLSHPALLFVGLVWLGSGGATLYSYIRYTQPPAPEAE
jgi:MFS family permease